MTINKSDKNHVSNDHKSQKFSRTPFLTRTSNVNGRILQTPVKTVKPLKISANPHRQTQIAPNCNFCACARIVNTPQPASVHRIPATSYLISFRPCADACGDLRTASAETS